MLDTVESTNLLTIANVVRGVIFSNFGTTERQCKRSAMLIDMVLKTKGYKSWIESGKINVPAPINTGHVWNVIMLNRKRYILDISLDQFQPYYAFEVPSIVFGLEKDVINNFLYKSDMRGKYPYDKKRDIASMLVAQVFQILDEK